MNQINQSTAWPLLFSHHGTILGKGFLADIEVKGRVLATLEADGVWIDGVHPGGIALGAQTLNATHLELRNTLARIFIDFAMQTSGFDEFKARVETFFHETDPDTLHEWDAAVEAVRAGRVVGPDGIPRCEASTPCYVKVTRKLVESVTPSDNTIVQQESLDELYAVYADAA
ncbi:MAG: hypothetical protein ABL971_11305 [Vicinamibacterales bacterium]